MAAPALRNTVYSEFSNQEFEDNDDEFDAPEFLTGERLCPPRPRRGAVFKLLSWFVVLGALYGGWSLWKNRPAWLETVATDASALWSALNPKDSQPLQPETAAQAPPPAAPAQAVTETEIADAPGAEAGTAFETVTVAASPDAAPATTAQSEAVETGALPAKPENKQAATSRTDRYEKQAEAVGLNPDLSRALLKRLTETDFRNAGIAIKTALAKTAEADVFNWPEKAKPNLALFEVRFVPGAAENCRRYVVTVTKDRWSTTAPPMEKCGIGRPASYGAKASAG